MEILGEVTCRSILKVTGQSGMIMYAVNLFKWHHRQPKLQL